MGHAEFPLLGLQRFGRRLLLERIRLRRPYTPFFLDKTSVTAGKRMEALRESAEDYEYLVMLREQAGAARQRGKHGPTLERVRNLLTEAARRVCEAKGASALAWASAKDRGLADQVRLKILETLAELSRGGKP